MKSKNHAIGALKRKTGLPAGDFKTGELITAMNKAKVAIKKEQGKTDLAIKGLI